MTLLTWIDYTPPRIDSLFAPHAFDCAAVSVIVPVKDNQAGVNRFLSALFATHTPHVLPREVIIVDNRSTVPVHLSPSFQRHGVPVRLVRCERAGPASARNAGAAVASGQWLLFTDSDCEPTASFVAGFGDAMNGAVGYAGYVCAAGEDRLSRYYESQEILVPPRVADDRPQYLITANALVWKHAFEAVGGFDESYPLAGGEDVDLGFRLSQIGLLAYAPASVVRHDFSDGYIGFVRRFIRYGRGNRRVARGYGISLRPKPFAPARPCVYNWLVAVAQFACLAWGYSTGAGERSPPPAMRRAVPPASAAAEPAGGT
jgi:glycosyltransferase involved in cell wall biosynthesis